MTSGHVAAAAVSRKSRRQHAPGSADAEVQATLLNELGAGVNGPSGFLAHRNGADWATQFKVVAVDRPTSQGVVLVVRYVLGPRCRSPPSPVVDPRLSEEDADAIAEQLSTILADEG